MKLRNALMVAGALISMAAAPALADVLYTQGSGTTVFDFICFTTKHCPAHVQVNSAGTEIFTAAAPAQVTGANGTFPATQSGTWNVTNVSGTVSLPTGASTAAKQPALGTAGTASTDVLTVQGIASMTPFLSNPGTAANWGVGSSTQNSATVANGQLALAQFNTTPTTITSGNMSPFQLDSAGNLLVNVKAGGAGGGAVTVADGVDVTQGAIADAAVTAGASGSVSAKLRAISRDIGTLTTLFNANGRSTSANSSPVVQAPAPSTWHLIAAASTNATSVKASAATVFSCQLSGVGSTPAYLKIYNKASSPTVGTDTPVKTLIIPAAATAANGGGSNITFGPGGLTLGTGFAAAVTGGITVADTTSVAASTFAINCDYE